MQGDKTDLNASFRYFNEAYCNFFVCECTKYVTSVLLYQLRIYALSNACSVKAATGMVQMNKDERVWVCFELARVQTVHAVQRLWPNRWPVRRVPNHPSDTQELQKIQAAWYWTK